MKNNNCHTEPTILLCHDRRNGQRKKQHSVDCELVDSFFHTQISCLDKFIAFQSIIVSMPVFLLIPVAAVGYKMWQKHLDRNNEDEIQGINDENLVERLLSDQEEESTVLSSEETSTPNTTTPSLTHSMAKSNDSQPNSKSTFSLTSSSHAPNSSR